MTTLDIIVVVAYFAGVAAIGYWASRHGADDAGSYFLAGRGVGWMAIGASLFASNISAEHFIGLAGSGAASGLAVGQFEWLACFILILLGWVFVPIYLRTGVYTMPEFLEARYNRGCRVYLSSVSLVAYVLTKISVSVYAGAVVLGQILGWNIWVGAIALIVATGAYTVFGGLRAVIFTDFFQAGVLILGGVVLTVLAVGEAGGLGALTSALPASYFSVWHPASHPDFPWTGILFGAPILGIWYWCTDQMIVQRTLAARGLADAQRATLFAGFLKVLPVFILVLPGLAGSLLFPGVEPDLMYVTMVKELLPPGLKGLVVASLLAALMSSLSSIFNSSSTLVVMDFYKPWRPEAGDRELVRAGQVVVAVLVVLGLMWLPLLGFMSKQLFIYLQSVQAYVSPPIAAAFLLGLFWKRATGAGALAGLLAGAVAGGTRFVAEVLVRAGWADGPLATAIVSINFLHFAVLLFAASLALMIAVSLVTAPPAAKKIAFLEAREDETAGEEISAATNRRLAGLLACTVLALWVCFSPLVWK